MDRCFECGGSAECNHHVVPKSLGGTKTVPLCLRCHSLIHDRNLVRHKELQRIGIEKAKNEGKFLGRKKGTTKNKPSIAKKLRAEGRAIEEIATELGVSKRTIFRYFSVTEQKLAKEG